MKERATRGVVEAPKSEKTKLVGVKRAVALAVLAPTLTLATIGVLKYESSNGGAENVQIAPAIVDASSDALADFAPQPVTVGNSVDTHIFIPPPPSVPVELQQTPKITPPFQNCGCGHHEAGDSARSLH